MQDFLSQYGDKQRFNKEVITDLRKQDDIYEYLENICKVLESVKNVKYLGMTVIEDENEFMRRPLIGIKNTRMSLAKFKFEVKYKDEVEYPEIVLFVPKRINNNYFVLNGNKYYTPYQIIDSSTYNTKNSVILKSILMPIIIRQDKKKFKDTEGNEYKENVFYLNLFNKKINVMNYYLPRLGYIKTIKFLKLYNHVSFSDNADDTENYVYFNLKTQYLAVKKESFNKSRRMRNMVFTLVDVLSEKGKRINFEKIEDLDYWKVKLGALYTKNVNAQIEKADSVLLSFKRVLDDTTKKNLRIDESDKQTVYHLVRWMLINFESLKKKDNLSLLNKRFRYYEYIISPFLRKMSNNTYRILNTKNLTMNKLLTLFKISPMILIKTMSTSDLIRYNNAVNDMDCFNALLKYSMRGPQALSSSNTVSVYYRDINPTHVGRLALNHSSNTDPGLSGSFSPFIQTDGFRFNENDELDKDTMEDK